MLCLPSKVHAGARHPATLQTLIQHTYVAGQPFAGRYKASMCKATGALVTLATGQRIAYYRSIDNFQQQQHMKPATWANFILENTTGANTS
jgi:hypothetical protein